MRFLTVSVVLLIALAGCTADEPEPATETTTTTAQPTPEDPEPTPGGSEEPSAANAAPTASLTANASSGAAPFPVRFTIGGNDQDGDPISWSLATDGDGTEDHTGTTVPTDLDITYMETGMFNATLTVSDGNATGNASVVINVLEPAENDPNAGLPSPVIHSGSVTLPDPFVLSVNNCIMALGDFMGSGTFGDVVSVDATMENWAFFLEPANARVTFTSADGSAIGGNGNQGSVGAGMSQGITCATEPMVDYTLTIHHPDWTF